MRSTASRVRRRVRRVYQDIGHIMGMDWWDITFEFCEQDEDFDRANGDTAIMICRADWRYGRATILVNVKYVDSIGDQALEEYLTHEMMHILVNEMRQKEDCLAHEERVVTGLTKAFMWSREYARGRREKAGAKTLGGA